LKTYRSPRVVISELKRLISADKPSPHPPSVLVRIAKLLCESRNYESTGIFLVVDGREVPRAFSGPGSGTSRPDAELGVPIKIASRTLGCLRATAMPGHDLGAEDRVLLHNVAEMLARYLTGKGRYLSRKAREAVRESAAGSEIRGYQPSSDKSGAMESRRAAAGEKSGTLS
jgi:hypothetical protein